MSDWIGAIVAQFGALGVFALMIPESACIPIPSELTLMAAGFAVSRGWLDLPIAVAAATAGNLVGSLIAYGIGRAGALRRLAPRTGGAVDRCRRQLGRHGTRTVLLARLLPLARTFVSLPAGDARVPLLPFVLLTIAGSAIWAIAFELAGMAAGMGWSGVGAQVGNLLLGGALLAAVILFLARRRHGGDRFWPRSPASE